LAAAAVAPGDSCAFVAPGAVGTPFAAAAFCVAASVKTSAALVSFFP